MMRELGKISKYICFKGILLDRVKDPPLGTPPPPTDENRRTSKKVNILNEPKKP